LEKGGRKNAVVFVVVALVIVAGLTAFTLANLEKSGGAIPSGISPSTRSATILRCELPQGPGVAKSNLRSTQFGAVTEYPLPQSSRWSNAVTVSSDGSVWFGEESVPGVGHLFLNGTLVEYPWPSAGGTARSSCGYRTGIWGIVVWNGMVWAADSDENAIVGVNPVSGRATVVNVSSVAPEPYTLALAPDGSLWFTTLSPQAAIGRLSPDLNVTTFSVNVASGEVPLQLQFVNTTYAYFVALNPLESYGHLYSFDPAVQGSSIDPVQLGGKFQLLDPSSVSASGSSVWVTQHGASDVARYDVASGNWTVFPTSTDNYTTTTLPYFVHASGQEVWFNEHYANRIAALNSSAMALTEYSEANPPIENGSLIQNDLTIAPGDGGLWFTSVTGNYIGFVNGSAKAPFHLSVQGADSAALGRGGTVDAKLLVQGAWPRPLQVAVSDSEDYDSVPNLIHVVPGVQQVPAGSGPAEFQVSVAPGPALAPGRYTVAVTVSDGLVSQTAYFFLNVS